MQSNNNTERRRFLRIPFESVLECKPATPSQKKNTVKSDAVIEALSKNISQSGILINTTSKTCIGDELQLKVTVPSMDGYSTVKIIGKVTWVRQLNSKSYDCGVQFSKINSGDADIIRDFIQYFPAEQEELEIETEVF